MALNGIGVLTNNRNKEVQQEVFKANSIKNKGELDFLPTLLYFYAFFGLTEVSFILS